MLDKKKTIEGLKGYGMIALIILVAVLTTIVVAGGLVLNWQVLGWSF